MNTMNTMSAIRTVGIDLAKNVFQIHGVDKRGHTVLKKRVSRKKFLQEIEQLPKCLIGMEACGGSNHWARKFIEQGHKVKLMNPKFVKPYVKSCKNDANDAEAICEAVSRPSMRFSGIKTAPQQDIQSLHRIRSRLVRNRTALTNQTRALLLEYGIEMPKGYKAFRGTVSFILEKGHAEVSELLINLLQDEYSEFLILDKKIVHYDKLLDRLSREDESCRRLMDIDGVGPKTATAIVAMIGDGRQFANGRQLSAFFGLVPAQYSSGGKEILLGITKRGDGYIRGLLVHGARSLLRVSKNRSENSYRETWFLGKELKRGTNKAIVAMANKQARIIWAVLTREKDYERNYEEKRRAAKNSD